MENIVSQNMKKNEETSNYILVVNVIYQQNLLHKIDFKPLNALFS